MIAADPILDALAARLARAANARRHKARAAGLEVADLYQTGMAAALESLPGRRADMTDAQALNWLTLRAVGAMADMVRSGGRYRRGHLRAVFAGRAGRFVDFGTPARESRRRPRPRRVGDVLADPKAADPTAGHDDAAEWAELVLTHVGATDAQQWAVIDGYFRAGLRMRAIGDALGVTESRISQIRSDLIARARARAGVGS